ncbi:MAG: DUF4962 domain-containing protein [Candidatus Latescibacteria bacterium]|nr:DUF4962 domain-containing protein [Candidatus Latescibacterota bacterium]
MFQKIFGWVLGGVLMVSFTTVGAIQKPDETAAKRGEWGFRPTMGEVVSVTPPGFVWRPQAGATSYGMQVAKDSNFKHVTYAADNLEFFAHAPPQTIAQGDWFWRFRYSDGQDWSAWSSVRSFTVPDGAKEMPVPLKADLMARIPKSHPRLFVRPEWVADYRARIAGDLKPHYERLVLECDKWVAEPPSTVEPALYEEGMKRGSDPWRKLWWGNRRYTQKVMNAAATLAFTYILDGNEQYAQLAKDLLMACAEWDPKGATGYDYNDEAGMPYNYYFSRTYTFLYDRLSEEERARCQSIMRVRGQEMYAHLNPRHLWKPYSSHSNRAWHFLGEVGIAFLGEIPEAEDWVWFATHVFATAYPVWSDSDGGWHEGTAYWHSYLNRFTWWADVMKAAMDIDAFDKPFFSQAGYYPMYLTPPGTKGGGFGDLTARRTSKSNVSLTSIFTAQAQNPHWQWYVDVNGGAKPESGYIGFIRGAMPKVVAKEPTDLPTSRIFQGIGQAMLNSNLMDAKENVQLVFKSSPFGTQSHGYESQNAFLIYAFGERLFIRTGRRDSYGSEHHRNWMWETKSINGITVNGKGQGKRTASAVGKIVEFATSEDFDFVVGEASDAYPDGLVDRFTRAILFVKPDIFIVHDVLEVPEASTFEWHLHTPVEMTVNGQNDIRVVNKGASAQASFLWPQGLGISQTDKFDVPPRPRVKLVEYHLTAKTPTRSTRQEFVTVLRPYKSDGKLLGKATLERRANHFVVRVPTKDGEVRVRLQSESEQGNLRNGKAGEVEAWIFDQDGKSMRTSFISGY